MKFIETTQIQLAYLEKNTQSDKTVFFIHGNSGSSRTWRKQFSSELFNDYRLIAFDLPGCGQSVIENNSAWDYSPIATGRIIAEAVKKLSGDNSYCLIGFSYGSNIVAEALNYKLIPKGISLLASCVIGDDIGLDKIFVPGDNIFFHDEAKEQEVSDFFSNSLISAGEDDTRINTEDFFLAKPPFRSALIQSVMNGKVSNEIALIKEQKMPVQVLFGSEDKLLQINYLDRTPFKIWNEKVYKLSETGHYVQSDQPEPCNRLLAEYLKETFNKTHA
ncbi:MAG TPA: alpha/beta hydrolase [Chitinophagaceae bacterium]|nr:alpha/beta hydrolase [Chitinophagaceae bacterium]